MDSERDRLAALPEGHRDESHKEVTWRLAKLVNDGHLDRAEVVDAMVDAARGNGNDKNAAQIERDVDTAITKAGNGFDWSTFDDRIRAEVRSEPRLVAPPLAPTDDAEFWTARESLRQIHDYALACAVSPWGVLGACLVYALDTLPHNVALPGIAEDESPGSLSLFVALATRSGGNKGRTVKVARRLMRRTLPDLQPGSGEGLVKCFVRARKGDDDAEAFEFGGDKFTWLRHSVVLNVAEVETLAALGRRTAATLPMMLRQAFSGETLGFAYADDTKRLFVPGDEYRLGMIVGVQPECAGPLFDDTSGGTPQRFLWLPTTDRRIDRHNRPAKPDPLTVAGFVCWRSDPVFHVCEAAREDIEEAADARARGEGDALDGHALFVRAKVAAALAVLRNDVSVSDEDWRLAGVVMEVSDHTRSAVLGALGAANERQAVKAGRADGLRQSMAADVQHSRSVERVVGVLVRAAAKHGPMKPFELKRKAAGRDKAAASDALELAIERGLLVEADGVVSAK
ncbi:hypothetical protein A5670_22820 [Mycolicibacterium fortuitum]|nr:hypothetical protein A5670_22820 [Mycolicibacterium fortuitum]